MPETENRVYGYIRVSTKGQHEDRQKEALLKEGVLERDIFTDKCSGKDFERPEYLKMKSLLQPQDRIVILDIDRLGRNYEQMANEWREITQTKKCDITVINLPLLSTVREDKSLDRRFMADMIFSILSYVAERERQYNKSRQVAGIEAAHNKGVKFGRPKVEKPENFEEVYKKVLMCEISSIQAREELGLKTSKYYEFVRAYRKEHGLKW